MTRKRMERRQGSAPSATVKESKRTTKMEFNMNAKGKVPLAVTAEYSTPEESARNAKRAIQLFKEICKEEELSLGDKPF